MSVFRNMNAYKAITAFTILVILSSAGCTKKYENESAKHFASAKELLAKPVINSEDLRTIEYHLVKVDSRSPSYKEARKLLPQVQAKISNIDKNKAELAMNVLQEKLKARKESSPQKRTEYAKQYENDYERIQVGAKAKSTGKGNRTLNIYLKYDFDDLVRKRSLYYIQNQWMELGFTKVVFFDRYGSSWEKQIPLSD